MRKDQRLALRVRFAFRCGYCGVRERDVGAELTVDHFQPQSKGGPHEPENWVYCCHACNEFKGDFWQPDSGCRLLHPLLDNLTLHLAEQKDGILHALTETGQWHIDRLRLNRPQLVEHRLERRLRDAEHDHEMDLMEEVKKIDAEIQSITAQLDDLRNRTGGA